MLLSKLDQRERCEACIGPHGDGESGGMRREVCVSRGGRESDGGGDRRCYLWTDIWKEKKPKTKARLRLCTPLILPLCLAARVFASSFVPDRPAVRVEYIICQRLLHIRPGLIYQ